MLGLHFEVIPGDVDETVKKDEPSEHYVQRLAVEKARSLKINPDQVIIAADTVVVDRGEILGKPGDKADAKRMLQKLRGHTHTVMTAITLVSGKTGQIWMDLYKTAVPMREYADLEIEGYIESGDPMDKAGAYAIQHPGFHPVARMDGCFASVMGLPVCHVILQMRKMDLQPDTGFFAGCETLLEYNCPVSNAILNGEM